MKNDKIKYFLILLFNFIFIVLSYAQIIISNISEIDKIVKGKTYIAMKDPNSPIAKEYIRAFWDSWTIGKVEFIKYAEFEKYISPDAAFLIIGGYETKVPLIKMFTNDGSNRHIDHAITHLYLELFTCNKKFVQAREKEPDLKFTNDDKIQVARLELSTDKSTLGNPDNIYQADYDAGGHIRNWGPGVLKNQIQNLMNLLLKKEIRNLFDGEVRKLDLINLKSQPLFVPDYILQKYNKLTEEDTEQFTVQEIFDDYKLRFKIVSSEELNKKIMNDKEPFYYLIYIRSQQDKYICVFNSHTGAMVYSRYYMVSYNIDSGDLKDIRKKVSDREF